MRLSLLVLALSACTQITATPLNASPRQLHQRSPDSVKFVTATPADMTAVSLITIRGALDNDGMVAAAREKAAAMGCDAILVGGTDNGYVPRVPGRDFTCLVAAVETRPPPASAPATPPTPTDRAGLSAACEQHNGDACHRLGEDFEIGKTGPKDLPNAIASYDKGCTLGDKNDCRRRDLLRKKI